ncbi:hypothetical protein Aph02nite_68800 [Actinoplanes philippinensis]|uniref:DUF6959 family protein n=1 Tax=Actinoplanes philippinensis TaxID=35752 RepID=UPI000B8049EC|nr:hypothetical protein [Actinoplanes philippinensis]GIE80930.1 hypothetical protein Aph02nite_68800 [Actinoplanes philippinensis]
MDEEHARVLARRGNFAVTQLDGRAFPGVHVQGDTFAELYRQLQDAVSRLHDARDDADSWGDLEDAVKEMASVLRFYEEALEANGIRRPYSHQAAD